VQLSNAGRSTHKVMRHVAAISSIRERTLHIAGMLFSTNLSLQYLYGDGTETTAGAQREVTGVSLTVQRMSGGEDGLGKTFHAEWKIDADNAASRERAAHIVSACVEVEDAGAATQVEGSDDAQARYNHLLYGLAQQITKRSSTTEGHIATVVFPCVLLHARFDQFSIIRSTYVFFLTDIHCVGGGPGRTLEAAVYCAQEVWELCHASSHIVGEPLPLSCMEDGDVKRRPNMVMPLAYTPLLFALYVERGRAYHSAVNVTADCMALTVASLQWAKVYHDVLLFTVGAEKHLFSSPATVAGPSTEHKTCVEKLRVLVDQALKAAVALSYSIDSAVMLPSKAGLNTMFGYNTVSADDKAKPDPTSSGTGSDVLRSEVVISREDCAGLTCSIAFAALLSGAHLPYADAPASWNILLRTLFSRLAESISGTKIIRNSKPAPTAPTQTGADAKLAAVPQDPGNFEHEYRLKLGELQGHLRKRLNTEWPKCSAEAKRAQVAAAAPDVLRTLQEIATLFLNRLGECGLQSWSQVCNAVRLTLLLKQHGIQDLRDAYIRCDSVTPLVERIIAAGADYESAPLVLPVCEMQNGGAGDVQLIIRELTEHDTDHMVMYIDAIVATKAAPKVEYKPVLNPNFPTYSAADSRAINVQHASVTWNEVLPSVNIAFIGNVNSGKSSISGILLTYMQIVPEHSVERLGREAVKLGLSETLKHAWVMDRSASERRGGFTINPTWAGFQTPSRRYTIIDNPGHKDFCRNAAFGVFEADAVVLVMPADVFGAQAGSDAGAGAEVVLPEGLAAQAEEHLVTAFCFGVRELVVAVNKMDLVNYSQGAFEAVRTYTLKLLKKAGFKPESAVLVPVSVLHGEGFLSNSEKMSWYSGACLLQACDELPLPRRATDKPLRMVVDEVCNLKLRKNEWTGTAVLCGKVERGILRLHDEVTLFPTGPVRAKVQSIQLHGTATQEARAGDNVGILVAIDGSLHPGSKKLAPRALTELVTPTKGCIVTLSAQPAVTVMNRFEVQLLVMRGKAIAVGYKPALTTHLVTVSVHITRLVEIIGRNNAVLESNPTSVKVGQTVVCEMTALRPFAAETIHDMPRLSRFMIKENRTVMAIGFIRRVIS
jgi:translation elongation factor EF-1alpha